MEKILEVARKEIGTVEIPTNSNRTKYGQWFGLDGVAWCGIFVSYCYYFWGKPLGRVGFLKGFAGCQTAVAHYKEKGKIVIDPEPGDIVFFDWNGDGRYDHTGIFVNKKNEYYFYTIEGNTSMSNNSNGGMVMERVRKWDQAIFVRP